MTPRQRAWFFGVTALCIVAMATTASALAGLDLTFSLFGERFALPSPEALALGWTLPIVLTAALFSLVDLPSEQRALSLLVRASLLACLSLALSQLSRVRETTKTSVVIAVDVSDSIDAASLARAQSYAREVFAARGANDVQLVTFASRPHHVQLPRDGTFPIALKRHEKSADDPSPLTSTNLEAAVQLAYGLLPSDRSRRVLLLSDGNETQGDLAREAARAKRLGVRIDHQAFDEAPPRELAMRALDLPESIEVGKPFRLHARVFSTTASRARLTLFQDGAPHGASAVRELELAAGDTDVELESIVRRPGPVKYRVELSPLTADRFAENNAVDAARTVRGRPQVLLVSREPARVASIARALLQGEIDTEVRSPTAMPRSPSELERYDFVILSDVPNAALPDGALSVLERYVRDLGGGFMMAGGAESFGLGGYQGTRMEQLLPVRMSGERSRREASLALALVIDCSGSMAGQKLELAKEAARATAETLADDDLIEVIGFSGQPERKVRLQSARNRVGIAQNIGKLMAQGGTQIFPALDTAYQVLSAARARVKHVILLTDGQTQESGIPELVAAMRAESITVSTVGLGTDVNRGLLQDAASLGGGRSYVTSDPRNVPRIFLQETSNLKRDSAVEEPSALLVREPADFLKGIDVSLAPLLRGYVATQAKPKPAQVVLESERGEPIVARWHAGLGYALAWTTDLEPRWAADLLRWPSFPRLFAQLVREHMRAHKTDELPMRVTVSDGVAHVSVDAIDAQDRFMNDLQSEVSLVAAGGPAAPAADRAAAVVLRQVGPGRYEAELALPGYGSFTLEAAHRRAGVLVAKGHAEARHSYPSEYAALRPNHALLRRASALTGGLARPGPRQIWQQPDDRVLERQELWPSLVTLALLLFLVDIGVRRIRIFDKKVG